MCLRPRRTAVDYTVFFRGGGARAVASVGLVSYFTEHDCSQLPHDRSTTGEYDYEQNAV